MQRESASSSEKKTISVHVRLSIEAAAVLELLCAATGRPAAAEAGALLDEVLLGKGHALKVAALKFANAGFVGIARR